MRYRGFALVITSPQRKPIRARFGLGSSRRKPVWPKHVSERQLCACGFPQCGIHAFGHHGIIITRRSRQSGAGLFRRGSLGVGFRLRYTHQPLARSRCPWTAGQVDLGRLRSLALWLSRLLRPNRVLYDHPASWAPELAFGSDT